MQTLHLAGKPRQIPSQWAELTPAQLRRLATLQTEHPDRPARVDLAFALGLLGLKPQRWAGGILYASAPGGLVLPLDGADRLNLVRSISPLRRGGRLYPTHTASPLRHDPDLKRRLAKARMAGWGDAMADVLAGEFLLAEQHRQAGDTPAVLRTVVRPADPSAPTGRLAPGAGDPEAHRGAVEALLTPIDRQLIAWYYEGALRHLAALFPHVFPPDDGEGDSQPAPGRPVDLIYRMAAGDPTRAAPLRAAPLWDLLLTLETQARDAARASP